MNSTGIENAWAGVIRGVRCCLLSDFEAGSARRAFMARTRPQELPRHLLTRTDNGARLNLPTPFSPSGSASSSKPSSTTAHSVEPEASVHLPALDGSCRHLSNRQELPYSVEMIEKYCASQIKTSLDAVAINVMLPKKRKPKEVSFTRLRE